MLNESTCPYKSRSIHTPSSTAVSAEIGNFPLHTSARAYICQIRRYILAYLVVDQIERHRISDRLLGIIKERLPKQKVRLVQVVLCQLPTCHQVTNRCDIRNRV